jgi:hypothetical protein
MKEALRIITDATGCNVEQAQAAIDALIDQGWSAPPRQTRLPWTSRWLRCQREVC